MKKAIRLSCVLGVFFIVSFRSSAGICQQTQSTPFRKYATQPFNAGVLSANPAFSQKLITLEDSVLYYKLFGTITPKIVPVVFHVLQSPGMPYIPESTLYRQLDQLNYDFNVSGPDTIPIDPTMAEYESRALIPQILFCLADSVGGEPISENLIRRNISIPFFPISNQMKSGDEQGSDPVYPDKCLNIWICNLPDSIAGYAQYPGGPLSTDGIVISYKYLIPSDSILNTLDYNKGKTLTHLVGNYLGVYELWNEANPCYDDYEYDTPVHNEPNHGFDMYFGHVSTCLGNELEMIINFMDNTFDSLAFMFTKGQVARMHCVLSSMMFRGQISVTPLDCNGSLITNLDSNTLQSTMFNEETIKVYPNPASNEISVDLMLRELSPVTLLVFDISGKRLLTEEWNEDSRQYIKPIIVSDFAEGLYFISIRTKNEHKVIPVTIFN